MRSTRTLVAPALTLTAIASTLIAGAGGAAHAQSAAEPVQISSDPYTNPTSQHATQVEPDSYSNGDTIVMATQSGRFFDGGGSNVDFARSTDGGQTWSGGGLPNLTVHGPGGGPFDRASDPVVTYSAAHDTWLIGSLGIAEDEEIAEERQGAPLALEALQDPEAVVVQRSTDDGQTWGAPVTVGTGTFPDKNWTACDNWPSSPNFGNCYTEWDENSLGNRIRMSTSTDGGASWGPTLETANNAGGLGGTPVPQPNGNVVVPIGSANLGAIQAFRSTNGGASWSSTSTITGVSTHNVAGNIRDPAILSADVDASGRIYVVWHDCRFRAGCSANDMVMTTSTDGLNWTPVTRIPIDPTNSGIDHFIPGLAVDHSTGGNNARLALTYYYYPQANCSGDGCEMRVGFISSDDGGQSWASPTDLGVSMRPSWLANTSQGRMVGDYISTSFVDGQPVPIFSAANAPSGGTFDQAIHTADLDAEPPPPGEVVFEDDFESDQGWTTNPNGSDNATTGQWERANPQPTSSGGSAMQLDNTTSGVNALVTGAAAGGSVGANDIDGGVTSIESPAITLPGSGDIDLSLQYYLAHLTNATNADFFRVSVVSGGSTTPVFEQLGAGNVRAAAWGQAGADLSAFAGQTVQILVEAADDGSGSLVEAAVDDLVITGEEAPPPPGEVVFEDDFESAQGWATDPNGSDTATTGIWERANPEPTSSGGSAMQLGDTTSGANALVTAAAAGAGVGANDIDGGVTSVQSPAIALPGSGALELSFQQYLAHLGNATGDDFLRVSVVSGTGTTTVFEQLGAASVQAAGWSEASVDISDFAGQTVQILVQAADAGSASLVEAAVDDLTITQTP